jgi:hypothetical protein
MSTLDGILILVIFYRFSYLFSTFSLDLRRNQRSGQSSSIQQDEVGQLESPPINIEQQNATISEVQPILNNGKVEF